MKKGLKIGLITGASILVTGGARAGLTKTGVIPNWFEIEALCSCVDCKGKVFGDGDIPQVNGKECCEGTYSRCVDCKGDFFCDGTFPSIKGKECCEGTYSIKMDDGEFGSCSSRGYLMDIYKPIIYLYPTVETKINVTLGIPEKLSHTYPKYNPEKGRNVIAQPNGDLEDIETGRKLYALYWEGKSNNETNFDEGFVVAGKDIIPFLEEKLAILGLNEREAEEFIVYWLPQMEDKEWNLIRFESIEEQDKNMPLNITPKPNTVIRIMMDWKAVDEPIDIPEQQLTTPERNGFTVVEWGGSPRN